MSNEEAAVESWLDVSGVGDEYMRHEQAMLKAARVPVHKAFALAAGYNVGMLRMLADNYKPKKIVVVEHGESGFEVRRLADSANVKLFYDSLVPAKVKAISNGLCSLELEQISHLQRIVKLFFESKEDNIVKYDVNAIEAKKINCIGYAYIQRRVASIAAFKNNEDGATVAIHNGLMKLEEASILRKLSPLETEEFFNSSAVFYRVDRDLLERE